LEAATTYHGPSRERAAELDRLIEQARPVLGEGRATTGDPVVRRESSRDRQTGDAEGPLSGWSSRRINDEHRLIHRGRGNALEIAGCHGHYLDK
jgi:hypothetical protein